MTELRKRNGGIGDKTWNGGIGDKTRNDGIGDKTRNGGIGDKTRNGGIGDKTRMAPMAEERIKRGIVLNHYNGYTLFKVYLFITVP